MLRILMASAVMAALAAMYADGASAAGCEAPVSAEGRAANPMNFDPPQHYDMEATAKARARAAWRQAVKLRCPGYQANWPLAHRAADICEGYAGGISCTVSAVPARI